MPPVLAAVRVAARPCTSQAERPQWLGPGKKRLSRQPIQPKPVVCRSEDCHRPAPSEGTDGLPSRRGALGLAMSSAILSQCAGASAGGPEVRAAPVTTYSPRGGAWEVNYPSAWAAVPGLDTSGNLQASFYNPGAPGQTIAIFFLPAGEALSVADLGSPEEVGIRLAGAAPGYQLISATRERQGGGREFYYTHIHALGMAAGDYGAAEEFRAITVRQGVQYVCRATATTDQLEASPQLQGLLQLVLDSFVVRA